MTILHVTNRDGDIREIDAPDGLSLMETLRNAGYDEIEALCGGSCACATCHVYVDGEVASHLQPMSEDENDLLDAAEDRNERSRLSCQIKLSAGLSGLKITIAPES